MCSGLKPHEFLTSENIDMFQNCTVIDGNLKIVQTTFDGLVKLCKYSQEQSD